jgi:Domain of unknown function (DUF2828)
MSADVSLSAQSKKMFHLPSGNKIDFPAVFSLLLDTARLHNIVKEEMVKTIFVFNNQSFHAACATPLEDHYAEIQDKYRYAGYEVPQIIYWNMYSKRVNNVPLIMEEIGTTELTGWSGKFMSLFLEKGRHMIKSPEILPLSQMEKVVGKDRYDVLEVLD